MTTQKLADFDVKGVTHKGDISVTAQLQCYLTEGLGTNNFKGPAGDPAMLSYTHSHTCNATSHGFLVPFTSCDTSVTPHQDVRQDLQVVQARVGVLYVQGGGIMTFTDILTPNVQTEVQIRPGRLISWDNTKFQHAVSWPGVPQWSSLPSLAPVCPAHESSRRCMIGPFTLGKIQPDSFLRTLKRVGLGELARTRNAPPAVSGEHVRVCVGTADLETTAAETAVNAVGCGVVFYDCLGNILPTQFTVDCVVINNTEHSSAAMRGTVVNNQVECSAYCNIKAWQRNQDSGTEVSQGRQLSHSQGTPAQSTPAGQLGEERRLIAPLPPPTSGSASTSIFVFGTMPAPTSGSASTSAFVFGTMPAPSTRGPSSFNMTSTLVAPF